jgi:hypothetical protein
MTRNKWQIVLFLVFLFLPFNSLGQSSTSKTLKTITIQVVSLKNAEKAEQELARLESHGLDPFMRHEPVKDKGMWYRIYVGRFEKRDDATKFAQEIKDRGIISGFWVKQIEIPAGPEKTSQTTVVQPDKPEMKVDAGHEKQASPPVIIEMPKTVIPIEEKPSLSQPPAEKSKDIIPRKTQEPVPTARKEAKEILPTDDIHEKEPISPVQGIAVQGPDKQAESGRFTLGVKSSYFLASNTDNFKIKRTAGSDQKTWSFKNPKVYNSLISSYRFNPTTSIEATIERAFFTKLDIWHLNMGPKFEFRKIGMLTPYAKGSLVIGHLDWDEVPGDFDTAWGWEGGFGVSFTKSKLQFGLETSYRSIKYDYNRPSDAGVTATDSQLDFSGFALSGTLSYRF